MLPIGADGSIYSSKAELDLDLPFIDYNFTSSFSEAEIMKSAIFLALTLYLVTFNVALHAKVIWAIQDEWPPYIIDSSEYNGIAHEIIAEAFSAQGYELKLTIKPWSRALREVATQRYDIALTVWKSSERLEYLYFSEPYLINSLVFVTLNGNSFDYHGLKSLEGKRIGVLRGYAYDDAFMNSNDFDRLDADNIATNIKKLKAGRIDALIADKMFFKWFIKNNNLEISDFQLVKQPLAENPLYIAISRDHPKKEHIIFVFNTGLKSLQETGRISVLLEQYE
ncbi:putative amino acid ABC transporter, periplasmic amino acid-binding protein [Vibrio orientalis CIP 102891 = ATCC 33934]|uniref:ABC transporter substrate-binding protein n=1 Tax=Vibrio orientalis CIP 102891 = ATCC 33934 TaxID=675816 RepID=C9QF79_VIBOR|nr:transporter substrate-binding domain-containing protein [Vibrio orientalis]EEX94786.1 ABC transporter substrate-binding protein [Vibrio orientalis CIP 102891 = ATCC 33934]EGU53085.1 putative amino acid ABC transporter, periplasmic amino acid-binding protein [Vibrio orientalis CIP 102891 = ATCC 33934]